MATIMHFPTVTKSFKEQALKTALPPVRSISLTMVQGGFGKTKLSSLSSNLGNLKLSSPKSSSPSIMIAAMSLLDEVEDEVLSDDSENEFCTSDDDDNIGYQSEIGFCFRHKRKKSVKKLKKNRNLDKNVTFYDGYSKAIFRLFKQNNMESEGSILLGAVLPRKPRNSLPPAKFPSPPEKSYRHLPPRVFRAYKIAMRWPITLAILAGRNFPKKLPGEPTQNWFCVHFFRSMIQHMPDKTHVQQGKMKDFLMDLGIYSEMCVKWPSIGKEETKFWSDIYEKHGSNSELFPADYYQAGLDAVDALDSSGFLSRLGPGSYTKWEVENTFRGFKVDIAVRECAGFYLVKEMLISLDCDYKPCPGKVCITEPIPADSLIVLPDFVAFKKGYYL